MKTREIALWLPANSLFKAFSTAEVQHLASIATVRRIAKKEIFWHPGEEVDNFCLITEGLAHLSIALPAGKTSTIELYKTGDVVGCIGYLLGAAFPAGTSALIDSTAIFIPSAAVAGFGEVNLKWFQGLARLLAARVERHFLLRTICAQPAKNRVPSILLFLSDLMGNDIHLTQANIAELVCLSEATVCRALAPLRRRKLVQISRHAISIASTPMLKAYIEHPGRSKNGLN